MQIWSQLTFFDLVIFLFLAIIGVAFGCLVLKADTPERAYQKIIGGYAVFIVALISKNPYVIGVSLFIGGLIIASEHFMKSLAAILRADSPDIPSILYGKATEEDVKKKEEEEVKTIETLHSTNKSKDNRDEDYRKRIEKRRAVEVMVASALAEKFGGKFYKDVKLFDSGLIVDGVLSDPLNKNAHRFVEIKYFPKLNPAVIDFSLRSVIGRIRGIEPDAEIVFVLVSDEIDVRQAEKIETETLKRYKKISVLMYRYNPQANTVQQIDWF